MLKIQKQRRISQAKTKNFKKISMMLISAFLIIGIFSILSGCDSKLQPIDKIYTGNYVYFPEGSADIGSNSYITLNERDVCINNVYCEEIVINGTTERGVFVMSNPEDAYPFTYTATTFNIASNWYTVVGIVGASHTDYYIALSGEIGLKDLSYQGAKFKKIPTVEMYGTRMVLAGRIPGLY